MQENNDLYSSMQTNIMKMCRTVMPQKLLFFAILMFLARPVLGELKLLSVPEYVAPLVSVNVVFTRTDTYQYDLTDLKVTCYNADKTQALPKYKVHGQGKAFVYIAPGDMWQGRYTGYFLDAPTEQVTLKIEYERKTAGGWISTFTEPFLVRKEITIPHFRPTPNDADEFELDDKIESFARSTDGSRWIRCQISGP